ncbi:putative ribonuclease H-like domain-containing protein, partial [Tanacetum coccineum]
DIEEMDINWQIAMIAIRMKKFYKKTRRRVRIDGNKPVGFDKNKIECYKCHNTGHFARECPSKGTNDGKKSMTSNSKVGLGYEIQSNSEVLSYEEEMNRTVFKCTEEDFHNKPLYSRFSKTNNFKGVPHPLDGDYTPKLQEEIDDSFEGSFGNLSEHSSESESENISIPNEMSTSKSVTTNGKVVSNSKEVQPSCATHKMAREAELKKQRVFNTGNGVVKPVWNNANRVNHANHFVPRLVQLNAIRTNVNSVRPNFNTGRANVNSVRQNVNSVRTNINTVRTKQPVPTKNTNSFSPVRPQVNKFNQRSHFSKSHSLVRRPIIRNTSRMTNSHAVKGNWGTAVKTSTCYNWRTSRPNSNYNSGSNFARTLNDHPLKNMEDIGIFDSGCSGHMTGNKDHLEDFEEFKGGSVTFGGSKGYITDNGTEFKNRDMLEFCGNKGIKQEYSNARTPQQNGVAERMNMTLIEAARTMLADSLLPTTFWAEAVSTACYIFNRFDGKCDEGFLVGYSLNSKAYRVYNLVTKKVEVNLHVNFLEEKPNVKGVGYRWMLDIDYLTDSMNYIPVSLENQANPHAEEYEAAELIVVPTAVKYTVAKVGTRKHSTDSKEEACLTELQTLKTQEQEASPTGISEVVPDILAFRRELDAIAQKHLGAVPENNTTSTQSVNTGGGSVNTGGGSVNTGKFDATQHANPDDSDMSELEIFHRPKKGIFAEASYDEEGVVHDFNNLPTEVAEEPKKISEALQDDSWVEAMQEELLQFKLQQVWILVDLPHGVKVIGTKCVFRNKRDERGVVVKNKARLVAQGHKQEEGVDYDEVFAHVARIEAIRLFLAFASFMGIIVNQMDVKSAFRYGTIDEEVYVSQPPGFVGPNHPKKVYKVVKALYGLDQAPRAWYATLSTFLEKHGYKRGAIDKTLFIKKDKKEIMMVQVYVDDIIFGSTRKSWCEEFEALMRGRFEMSSMGELTFFLGLQVKQKPDGIFISQDKYVAEMLKKFDLISVKIAITPMETKVALTKYEEAVDVDVTPKTSHLYTVNRIFKYLKGKPNLGFWYPRESPFDLRLILWQCKKQTIVATSTTEAEYVAATSYCRQVLWVQNQMLDYGFNFMNTNIHIDNECTICIVKNPMYHSKTKHIEIRHHFIRDSYEKKLIRVEKIHTDFNVADLLTKAFDGPRNIMDLQIQTTAKTLADGTLELKATIDTIEYTITKASIRSKLQLARASGITMLLNNKIFKGMGHMGSKSGGWDQIGSNIATALICLSTGRV